MDPKILLTKLLKCLNSASKNLAEINGGGERGIRTPVTCYSKHAFQACAISHSATSPNPKIKSDCKGTNLLTTFGEIAIEIKYILFPNLKVSVFYQLLQKNRPIFFGR